MEEYRKYLDLFELTPEATITEIRKRYYHLKSLYSGDSIEITALNTDFSEELRETYLSLLDEAYERLSGRIEDRKPAAKLEMATINDELRGWIDNIDCFTGEMLKCVRERIGVDLKEIYAVTRIQPQHLKDIENEVFESFHAEVYLRSFLIEYANFLRLDTRKVLNDYLPRYRAWAVDRKERGMGDAVDWLTKMT